MSLEQEPKPSPKNLFSRIFEGISIGWMYVINREAYEMLHGRFREETDDFIKQLIDRPEGFSNGEANSSGRCSKH